MRARSDMGKDKPVDSLGRLYEATVEDWTIELHKEREYF